jgi:hypothetical protein
MKLPKLSAETIEMVKDSAPKLTSVFTLKGCSSNRDKRLKYQ